MTASLAQGGPCPNFLREWCFKYLCSGDSDSIQVSASDVTANCKGMSNFITVNNSINFIMTWIAQI